MTELETQEPLFSGVFLNSSGYALNFPDLQPKERLEPGETKDFKKRHGQEELEKSDFIARYIGKGYLKPIDSVQPTSLETASEKQVEASPTRDLKSLTTKKIQREGFEVQDGEELTEVAQKDKDVVAGTQDDAKKLPEPDTTATRAEKGEGGATVITQRQDEEKQPEPAKPEITQAGEVAVVTPPEDDEVEIEKFASTEEVVEGKCKGKNRFGESCKKNPPKGYSHCVAHMPDEIKIVYKKEKTKAKKKVAKRRNKLSSKV